MYNIKREIKMLELNDFYNTIAERIINNDIIMLKQRFCLSNNLYYDPAEPVEIDYKYSVDDINRIFNDDINLYNNILIKLTHIPDASIVKEPWLSELYSHLRVYILNLAAKFEQDRFDFDIADYRKD